MKLRNVWLTRNRGDDFVLLWRGKPTRMYGVYGDTGKELYNFCGDVFLALTGIRLKPGECRQVESITIKLKPKPAMGRRKGTGK